MIFLIVQKSLFLYFAVLAVPDTTAKGGTPIIENAKGV
jgi:hypothetical protein